MILLLSLVPSLKGYQQKALQDLDYGRYVEILVTYMALRKLSKGQEVVWRDFFKTSEKEIQILNVTRLFKR